MTDGRTEDGKWKIGQSSVGPETAIIKKLYEMIIVLYMTIHKAHLVPLSFENLADGFGQTGGIFR